MKNLTEQPIWKALQQHYIDIRSDEMRVWFDHELDRFSRYSLKCGDILLDYSRNRINQTTLGLLIDLAKQANLKEKIDALFTGQHVNQTENKAALHTSLRDPEGLTPHANVISQSHQQLFSFVEKIHSGEWKGATGKNIKHIVNIGIGGSHLGPMMATHALKDFAVSNLSFHFISSIDPALLHDVLGEIEPESTLFIISSKSFSTIETMTNASSILDLVNNKLGKDGLSQHVVAITAKPEKAVELGIAQDNIFTFWDWVGGRYSIWSAIGLPLILMIGKDHFLQFLFGAHEIDEHYRHTAFDKNIPVLLGLLGIWYTNFFHTKAHAIVPYSHRLRHLVSYIQQAEMESNGKSASLSGSKINYDTAPVVFGQEGCDGQHTYHQLLHQGNHLIPVDFILLAKATNDATQAQHDMLLASALSQAYALMSGKSMKQALDDLKHRNGEQSNLELLSQHQTIAGNKPSNLIILDALTPKSLGALLAIYEHKIFTQSAIWDINPFDQWGVELGKHHFAGILDQIKHPTGEKSLDSSTLQLIKHIFKVKGSS